MNDLTTRESPDVITVLLPWDVVRIQGVRVVDMCAILGKVNSEVQRITRESIEDGEPREVWKRKGESAMSFARGKVARARKDNAQALLGVNDAEDRRAIAMGLVKLWGAERMTPDRAVANSCGWSERQALNWIDKP